MALTPLELTKAPLIFNWSALMCTTMKLLVANMFLVLFLWIWNLEPWTLSVPDLLVNFFALTTLSSVNLAPETIGPKVITPKVSKCFLTSR